MASDKTLADQFRDALEQIRRTHDNTTYQNDAEFSAMDTAVEYMGTFSPETLRALEHYQHTDRENNDNCEACKRETEAFTDGIGHGVENMAEKIRAKDERITALEEQLRCDGCGSYVGTCSECGRIHYKAREVLDGE